jgi:hypothetical protein
MAPQPPAPQRLSILLDQQLWFIGHDIRHAEGNALVRFGFARLRSGEGGGTTCYCLPLDGSDRQLVCWGFGVYIGSVRANAMPESGPPVPGVLIQRHAMTPRLLRDALPLPLHKPSALPASRSPVTAADWNRVHRALTELAVQLTRYESWARQALGNAHRSRVLAQLPRHKRRRFCETTDLAAIWSARANAERERVQ